MKTCKGCKYFNVCGDVDRTEPCKGKKKERMKRIPKSRTIYNNYNLSEKYSDEEVKETLLENGYEEDEITDELMWKKRYFYDEVDWEVAQVELKDFFNHKNKWILVGTVGRWDGVYKAGTIFETFDDFFYKATSDCHYIHFYDENGHLYLTCSHHDGTCCYEIKEVTDKGIQYLENWEDNWNDKRSEAYVHTQIFNRYSILPRFAEKVYGCKRTEYQPITKSVLIDKLNKQARSFYC